MYQSVWADPPPQAGAGSIDNNGQKAKDSAPSGTAEASPKASDVPAPVVTSALSAAAPTFAPLPADVPYVDEFAPTGAQQNDLFDDVIPSEESMRIRSDDDLFNDDFTPAPEPVVEHATPPPPTSQPAHRSSLHPGRGRGEDTRGRGRARGRSLQHNGRNGHHRQDRTDIRIQDTADEAQTQKDGVPSEQAPSGPRKAAVASVRGERHATGGVRKPKLTEDELAEKMARIQVKNASLTAAYARAEADAASFAERESQAKAVADQRRREERKDRQQMMGEREKNRQRKLKALGGREWDAEKREEDFGKGGRFDKKAGFPGDQSDYTDGREYLYHEPRNSERGRGRGGGGGRGQGGGPPRDKVVPKQEDFPALPPSSKPQPTKDDASALADAQPGATKSWAEQME